jgi:glycosyltransferase involved in cell wall biosynthesis
MRVSFVTHTVFHYRKPFHELVRSLLKRRGIEYSVYYGQPDKDEAKKSDVTELSFGRKYNNIYIYGARTPLIYQPVLREVTSSDLVIVIQENRLLINYLILSLPRGIRPKVAFFGHGRNYQSRNKQGVAEKWKMWWATKPDWWFAYTEDTRKHISSLGFPEDRITVFNNAIDTTSLSDDISSITREQLVEIRRKWDLTGENVGIYVGGIYPDKRLEFLVEAAVRVRAHVRDFELLVVGSGPSETELRSACEAYPWIKIVGSRFGIEKAELMRTAKLFLMPGAMGLAILDAGVASLPIITTDYPHHGPEIAYLEEGMTGLTVEPWHDPNAYAEAVKKLLTDEPQRQAMAAAAHRASTRYSIEAMAQRFAAGVEICLQN